MPGLENTVVVHKQKSGKVENRIPLTVGLVYLFPPLSSGGKSGVRSFNQAYIANMEGCYPFNCCHSKLYAAVRFWPKLGIQNLAWVISELENDSKMLHQKS